MFTKLANKMGKTAYALYGVKLKAQTVLILLEYRTETFAPGIDCVIDDPSLETMPGIDQALL